MMLGCGARVDDGVRVNEGVGKEIPEVAGGVGAGVGSTVATTVLVTVGAAVVILTVSVCVWTSTIVEEPPSTLTIEYCCARRARSRGFCLAWRGNPVLRVESESAITRYLASSIVVSYVHEGLDEMLTVDHERVITFREKRGSVHINTIVAIMPEMRWQES
jgi:hypothetical protein